MEDLNNILRSIAAEGAILGLGCRRNPDAVKEGPEVR